MSRKSNGMEVTGLQLEILQILWEAGEAPVSQVHETLTADGRKMAYTTAMTLCKRMADRGLLAYHKRDQAYIYRPAVKRKSLLKRLLGGIVDRAFRGSEAEMALAVLADAKIDADELAELQNLLAAKERELRERRRK